MAKFPVRLRELRTSKGLSQQKLADYIEISKSSINMYERGEREPGFETIEAIADFFNVDLDYLLGKSDIPNRALISDSSERTIISGTKHLNSHSTWIPILGRIAAGLPIEAQQDIEGYTITDLNGGSEYFALRVKGDSMTAAYIKDNSVLIVRRQEMVENGEIAVVMVNDESATVKRFKRDGHIVMLSPQSYNPEHETQIYDLQTDTIRILGKVVKCIIDF